MAPIIFWGCLQTQTDAEHQIRRIVTERVNYLARNQSIFQRSAIYQRLLHPAYSRWWPYRKSATKTQFEKGQDAIREMAQAVGNQNIIFIQLPQKDEVASGLDSLSERGQSFIRQSGLRYVDGKKNVSLRLEIFMFMMVIRTAQAIVKFSIVLSAR